MSDYERAVAPHIRSVNKIREIAVAVAHRKLVEITARQAVSDRVGYLLAALIGAGVFSYFGWAGVGFVAAWYLVAAFRAYRAWRKVMAS